VGKESRKLKRALSAEADAKKGKADATAAPAPVDPLPPDALRAMVIRVGLLVLALWLVGGTIAGFSQSETSQLIALSVPLVLTLVIAGVSIWGLGRAKRAKSVAGIIAGVQTDEDRKAALSKLDSEFKPKDSAAIFAKAQLQLQEDPRAALETLERIDLNKGMATAGDEARAQRGMIHLMLGEVNQARDLADGIDLSRHQDARSKAMMSAVIAEAWARSGQAKKAVSVLDVFNPEDETFAQLKPQLYRARAYVCAYTNDTKGMKRALRKLSEGDPRVLGGFLGKRTHPMLQREAKVLLEKSGAVQRKMQFQRM
jgi:hypothetical protein